MLVRIEPNKKDWMDMGCQDAPVILQAINSYGEWRKLYTNAVDDFMLIWYYILKKYNLQTRAIAAVIRDVVTKMQHLHTKLPPAYEFMAVERRAPRFMVVDGREPPLVTAVNRYFMTRQKTFPAVMEALSESLEKTHEVLQELWIVKDIYQKDALVPRRDGWERTQESYWNDFCESMRNLRAGPKAPENGAAGADVGNLTAKLAALKACV
jgi:hypothetical protein